MRSLLILAFILMLPLDLMAQQAWQVQAMDGSDAFDELVRETRQAAVDGLPDGLVASGSGDISSAWYTMPTTRYGHAILGDAIEAGGLRARTSAGKVLSLQLPQTEVFEDRYPRLVDLDGDGTTEIITIRSSVTEGASVTVYGIEGDALVERASTGFIGRANRWLNIAGIASFLRGKSRQIAFVGTPHIGGTLYFYEFDGTKLVKVASTHGFSNHAIGSREMRLSAVSDINGDGAIDLALPSDGRDVLRIMGFVDGKLTELASAPLPAKIDKAIVVQGGDANPTFVVGLGNGKVYRIRRPQ